MGINCKWFIDTSIDDWNQQVEQIDLLGGVAEDLAEFGKQAEDGISNFFGTDEEAYQQFANQEYKGMRIGDVLKQQIDSLVVILLEH